MKQMQDSVGGAMPKIVLCVWVLSGCVAAPPQRVEPNYSPTYAMSPPVEDLAPSSLFSQVSSRNLFGDNRATRVGDVVTIRLEERTRSSKSTETTLAKDTDNMLLDPIIATSLITGLAAAGGVTNSINNRNAFKGEADSDQSNSLTGTISVVVAERMPNGLLRVQGEKWLNLTQGEEFVRVSGLLRPQDIGPDNRVSSLRLADARIAYSATGVFADTAKVGWLARFFMSPLLPF